MVLLVNLGFEETQEKKKSHSVKSGERGGHATLPPKEIKFLDEWSISEIIVSETLC